MFDIFEDLRHKRSAISVTGLGYVGLPLALEFARKFKVIGFDINSDRIELMQKDIDPSKELDATAFAGCDIKFTSDPSHLKDAQFHIIGVPTNIDTNKVPNLTPLKRASESVGKALKRGDYVIYESTVYPGCTEEDCMPILEEYSCLRAGVDFKVGYSPERIVPGDKVRTLTKILKIVSGIDKNSAKEIAKVYNEIIKAGTYLAPSIKVAEAAKVIENTQRDINISLMNELSIIFDKMGIDTNEVIAAAATKWNFLKFYPGLVGGHCISVDPFYLLYKAKQLGLDPQVIAAGRRVNDYIPHFIAKRLVQTLIEKGKNPGECKILVMGVTFKEDVADIRNSKVIDVVRELMGYSLVVDIIDEYASKVEVANEYDIELSANYSGHYDAVIVAVSHYSYRKLDQNFFKSIMPDNPILFDLKGIYDDMEDLIYWRL